MITVGAVGFASVLAFTAFQRGENRLGGLPLVTILALLSVAGVLQVVKLSNPAPSNIAAPTPATPPPAVRKEPQSFFAVLRPLSGKYDTETDATIDGAPYPNSRGTQFCSTVMREWVYTLDDKYATFRAHLGLTGRPSPGTVVKFEAVADGKTIFTKDVKIGPAVEVEAQLNSAKQLTLKTTSNKKQARCENLTAQWADAQVVPN